MSRKTNTVGVSPIGIDTGKNTLHLVDLDDSGGIVLRAARLTNMPPCLIGIEAAWARTMLRVN